MSLWKKHERVAELAGAMCAQTITAQQVQELERLLQDEEARELYVDIMGLEAELPWIIRSAVEGQGLHGLEAADGLPDAGSAQPATDQRADKDGVDVDGRAGTASHHRVIARFKSNLLRRPVALSLTAATVAMGLAIAVMMFIYLPQYGNQAITNSSGTGGPIVATLLHTWEVEWADGGRDEGVRYLLAGSKVELAAGLTEIVFRDGASVILEGPSSFQVQSSSLGHLERGRLTAFTPPAAAGFTIRSPVAQLVDLGTEFGVDVRDGGATQVHVFSGKVEATGLGRQASGEKPRVLTEGESLTISSSGGLNEPAVPSDRFVRKAEFDKTIAVKNFQRWQKFVAKTKSDRRVAALYEFAVDERARAQLPNVAADERNGRIDGPDWTTGRWKDKAALRFRDAADCVHLDFGNQAFDRITVATWVNITNLSQPLTAVFYSNAWNRNGAVHFTLLADGRAEFALSSNQPAVVRSKNALLHRRLGRWVHLAVAYDADARSVRFYVDGIQCGKSSYTRAGPATLEQVQIGNWNQESRAFSGRIDESIVYRAALDEEEIREIFEAGSP